jgi:toxin ParE1/3/4
MSPPLRFHPAALRELEEGAAFYNLEGPGLGSAFLDEIDHALRQIGTFPDSSPLVLGPVRKKVVGGFPYSVIYSEIDETVVVLAVAHQRRRPFYWRDRA